jgi:hypothetical protein
MNERIRLLAEQARHNEPFECSYTKDQWLEKFAELIVRECAQFVEDKFDFIGEEIVVKEKMLEYFGVE